MRHAGARARTSCLTTRRAHEIEYGMESPAHAQEILDNVVRGLATGTGALSARLRLAYIDGLHQLTVDRFPWPDLREPLRDILDYFEAGASERLVIEDLDEADQRRVAGEIFDLFVEVSERQQGR